jgi:hypothetical protein
MGWECSMHGGNRKFLLNLLKNVKRRDYFGDTEIDEGKTVHEKMDEVQYDLHVKSA